MRTFISNTNVSIVNIAHKFQNFGIGRLDGSWKRERNEDCAKVLHALSDLLDFDPNESSSWTPSESDAVDSALSFVNTFYPRSDADSLKYFDSPICPFKVFINLNTGSSLVVAFRSIS
jgi:hypothetical protein